MSDRLADMFTPPKPSKVTLTIATPLGGHTYARTLTLRAQGFGLTVRHRHDGRLIIRTHLITLTGDRDNQNRFAAVWNRYAAARRRGDTAAGMRKRREDTRRTIERLVVQKETADE